MTQSVIDNKTIWQPTEIGKRYLFWRPDYPTDEKFGFSSSIDNIGVVEKHDRWLKNKTEVFIIADQTVASHPSRGPIPVIKVMAHQDMWIALESLWPIEDK